MKSNQHLTTIIIVIIAAMAGVFESVSQISILTTVGWGRNTSTGACLQKPIDGGYDCSVLSTGPICTVTVINSVIAYDTQANCLAGGTVGILKRP